MSEEEILMFYQIFLGKTQFLKNQTLKIDVDGKNDALFLTMIHSKCFTADIKFKEFSEKIRNMHIQNTELRSWLLKRSSECKENLPFVLWSAWETVNT